MKKQARVVRALSPAFLFAFLIIFRFAYLLLIFSLPVASLVVLRKQSFIFSQNFIPFLELILFKSIIHRSSKQPVIVYRWGGGSFLGLIRSPLDRLDIGYKHYKL